MSYPILETWSNAVNSHNIEDVLSLYEQDAVLVATFSPVPLTNSESIKSYFENLFSNPGAGVIFDYESINSQKLGESLEVLSGLYTFLKEEDGNQVRVAARFTYLIDTASESPINHHHSSQLP